MANEPLPEPSNRVIPLRPRSSSKPGKPKEQDQPSAGPLSVGDLAPYERGETDDYRHRMMANTAAFAFCLFLVVAGVWLAGKMAEMRKNQECVLAGRRGCAPVDVPARDRW